MAVKVISVLLQAAVQIISPKFLSYRRRSDWPKQRALSEIRERVDDIKLAFKFLLRNLGKFDPNYKHPLWDSGKININELFLCIKYGS